MDSESLAPALEARRIVKRYGPTVALSGVDVMLRSGEIHAVLGENGAGKSTLMHVLAGETLPSSGTICLNGAPVSLRSPADARRHGIAMVHQHFALAPALTVAENLALDAPIVSGHGASRLRNRFNYSVRKAATPALERAAELGWRLDPDAKVESLSVGQQQRVEIARAIATDAAILIFDEPTAVLNPLEVEELFDVLRTLRSSNHAVVLITHKLSEILEIADTVTVLRQGAVAAEAAVDQTSAAQLAEWMVGAENVPQGLERGRDREPARGEAADRTMAGAGTVCSASGLQITGERGEVLIRSMDLQVSAGEIYGIGGVDGNGQAELAEVLAGLRRPGAGTLSITASQTAYIPQDRQRSGLAVSMTVEENLLFEAAQDPAFQLGPLLNLKALRRRAGELAARYDIRTPSLHTPASALSGGNQQKIVVARALSPDPGWIVAINPTRGLDIASTRFVHSRLLAARNRGAAIVVISTDLDELAAISDRSAILAAGELRPYDTSSASTADIGLLLGGMAHVAVTSQPRPN